MFNNHIDYCFQCEVLVCMCICMCMDVVCSTWTVEFVLLIHYTYSIYKANLFFKRIIFKST